MMNQKTLGFIVVGLVIGVIGGYSVTSFQLNSVRTEMTANLNELSSEIKLLEDSLNESDSEIEALNTEIESYQADINELQDDLDSMNFSFNQLQVSHLALQEDYDELESAYTILNYSYSALQGSYAALQEEYDELESAYVTLNYSYSALQETYELFNVNLYKEVPFNITRSGVGYIERYFDFDIGYGIIVTTWIKVKTEVSNIQIGAGCSWTRGGESGYMGSSGRTYTQLETTLHGYAYCRIFDSGGGSIQVEVGVRPRNQTSWHGRDCFGTFPKEISET